MTNTVCYLSPADRHCTADILSRGQHSNLQIWGHHRRRLFAGRLRGWGSLYLALLRSQTIRHQSKYLFFLQTKIETKKFILLRIFCWCHICSRISITTGLFQMLKRQSQKTNTITGGIMASAAASCVYKNDKMLAKIAICGLLWVSDGCAWNGVFQPLYWVISLILYS